MTRMRLQQAQLGALENLKAGYPLEIMAMDIVGHLYQLAKQATAYSGYFRLFHLWAEAFGIPNQNAITAASKFVTMFSADY